MSWNEGYCTDITYTYGYYGEMNPAAMRFLMLMAGVTPPEVENACELGYGQGLSINIHAAAENNSWIGTDFNPGQAALAQEMAKVSGARAICRADSFHDFCNRTDLPEFDFIALHGIWSWISPENQANIVKLVDKKLRVGGVLYISYNTFPGWAAFKPARDLMKLYIDRCDAPGMHTSDKAAHGFAFMERLANVSPAFFTVNPDIKTRLDTFRNRDSHYLAHEFFNEDWSPCNFSDMARTLENARLSFACSAVPLQAVPGFGLSEDRRKFISEIADPIIRQQTLDFIYNTQFRKDYWAKGARPLQPHARLSLLRQEQFVLVAPIEKLTQEIKSGSGQVNLSEAAHAVLQKILADGKIHALAEFEKAAQLAARQPNPIAGMEKENLYSLAYALCALMSGGIAAPAQKKQEAVRAKQCADKLNAYIENRAIASGEINFLASPATGGGVQVPRFDLLYLGAIRRGAKTAEAMAAYARDCLNLVGQKIIRDGEAIEDQAEMLEYLKNQAQTFVSQRLPVLRNLLAA